jgi:hypothetical protein
VHATAHGKRDTTLTNARSFRRKCNGGSKNGKIKEKKKTRSQMIYHFSAHETQHSDREWLCPYGELLLLEVCEIALVPANRAGAPCQPGPVFASKSLRRTSRSSSSILEESGPATVKHRNLTLLFINSKKYLPYPVIFLV